MSEKACEKCGTEMILGTLSRAPETQVFCCPYCVDEDDDMTPEEKRVEFLSIYRKVAAGVLGVEESRMEILGTHNEGGISIQIKLDSEFVNDQQALLIDNTMRAMLEPTN
jgi:hypothetical protein